MGFKIKTIQVDNGHEFVNDNDKTSKDIAFEKAVAALGMELRRTRPYSPGRTERLREVAVERWENPIWRVRCLQVKRT